LPGDKDEQIFANRKVRLVPWDWWSFLFSEVQSHKQRKAPSLSKQTLVLQNIAQFFVLSDTQNKMKDTYTNLYKKRIMSDWLFRLSVSLVSYVVFLSVLYISVTVHRHVFCLLGFIHCQFSWFCSDMDSGPLFLSNSLSSLSDVRLPNVLCQLFPRSSVFSTLYQEFSLGLYPCLVLSCFLSCVYYLLCLLSFVFYISCTVSCVFCLLSVGFIPHICHGRTGAARVNFFCSV